MSKGLEEIFGMRSPEGYETELNTARIFLARLAEYDHPSWDSVDSDDKRGLIPVEFAGTHWEAAPVSPLVYRILNKEFSRKYRDSVGVVISFLNGALGNIVYLGFTFFKDKQPFGVGAGYPNKDIVYFDEKMALIRDRAVNSIELQFRPAEKNQKTVVVQIDSTGVKISSPDGNIVVDASKIMFGGNNQTGELLSWQQLKNWLLTHTHIGNLGAPTALSPDSGQALSSVNTDPKVRILE